MSNFLHNTWAVIRVVLARLRFLAVFLIAALVVGYWEDIRNHIDKMDARADFRRGAGPGAIGY